jgi:hypothetical protein
MDVTVVSFDYCFFVDHSFLRCTFFGLIALDDYHWVWDRAHLTHQWLLFVYGVTTLGVSGVVTKI